MARIEKASKLPCVIEDCPTPRAVTNTQVKTRCPEHQREYQANQRRAKGAPERKKRIEAPEGMWWCSRCEAIKPVGDCVKKGDKWGRCRACEIEMQATKDPDAVRKTSRDSRYRHRHRQTYGVSREEIQVQAAVQNGQCASCGKVADLVPDHDHNHENPKTRDAVRGLICGPCNLALGHLQDDPEVVRGLLAYILNPPRPFQA